MSGERVDTALEALLAKHTSKPPHPIRDNPERLEVVRRVLEGMVARRVRLSMPKIHRVCCELGAAEHGWPEDSWCGDTAWRKFLADTFPDLLERVRVS